MATPTATFVPAPDTYAGAPARVGTLATTVSTTVNLGKRRIYRLSFIVQPASSVNYALRFLLSNSAGAAPTVDVTSPFFQNNQENVFETGDNYDQITITNLAADNGAITLAYSFTPQSKF